MDELEGVLKGEKIAYFSMEIGLTSEIPTYAGGLGTLAGDAVRSSADLKLPLCRRYLNQQKKLFYAKTRRKTEDKQNCKTSGIQRSLWCCCPTKCTCRLRGAP